MRGCTKERKFGIFMGIFTLFIFFGHITCFAAQIQDADAVVLDTSPTPVDQSDPLQGFNRAMFFFNDKLDCFIMKPIAILYNKIIPKPLNQGIHNIYNNINLVPTIANDILQLHLYQVLHDSWRLLINTTIGIGGLFDVAGRIGLAQYNNDFGLTLATYGWVNSTYIVFPFFGPSTIRDGVEMPVDYYYFSIYPYIYPPARGYQIWALGVVDRRAQLLKFESIMEEAAFDKYIFVRNAYLQRRAYQIEENKNYWKRNTEQAVVPPVQESARPVSVGIGKISN